MNNSKKFFLVIALLLLGASLIVTNAQSDGKKTAKEKLNKLEGDVSSIVIKTDKGEVEFTAEEAQYLLKKMKVDKMIFSSHGGEIIELDHGMFKGEDGNMIIIKKKGKGDFNWTSAMSECEDDGTMKKIKVEVEDGVKNVTVTTTKDGEESVETYEGEEAEKFLESMDKKHGMTFHGDNIINLSSEDIIKFGDDDVYIIKKFKDKDGNIKINVITGEDGEHVFIHKDSDHDLEWITEDSDGKMKKEINVEVEDGVKTVTVTTTEDGEEKVEVFTGDEADEYLEKMHDEGGMDVKMKKMKRIIIEIEEEGDEDEEDEDEHEED